MSGEYTGDLQIESLKAKVKMARDSAGDLITELQEPDHGINPEVLAKLKYVAQGMRVCYEMTADIHWIEVVLQGVNRVLTLYGAELKERGAIDVPMEAADFFRSSFFGNHTAPTDATYALQQLQCVQKLVGVMSVDEVNAYHKSARQSLEDVEV